MSSSLSIANQKLKQFFGGHKTKDFDLTVSKNDFDRCMEKVIAFCNCLRVYEQTINSLPGLVERLYNNFLALGLESFFDAVQFQDLVHQCVRMLASLVDDQSGSYAGFAKFINAQQEAIKEQFKKFNETRQKFDHYKTKTDGLMKEYINQVDKKQKGEKIKSSKEVLDRNQIKLVNSENEYSKQLSSLKEHLTTFQESIKKITLSTFTETVRVGFRTITKMNDTAESITNFVSLKVDGKIKTQSHEKDKKKIQIQQYFQKRRQDNFSNYPNIFMDPKIHTSIPPSSISTEPQTKIQAQPHIDFFGQIPSHEPSPLPAKAVTIKTDFETIFSNPPSLKPKTPTHKGPVNANLLQFD